MDPLDDFDLRASRKCFRRVLSPHVVVRFRHLSRGHHAPNKAGMLFYFHPNDSSETAADAQLQHASFLNFTLSTVHHLGNLRAAQLP